MANREVIVVGSGAAGLSAAIAAASSGARVTLLERAPIIGGTTALSGGMAWLPNANRGAPEDPPDSREEVLLYLTGRALGDVDVEMVETFVDAAPRVVEETEKFSPLRWHATNWPDYHAEFPGGKLRGRSLEPDSIQATAEIEQLIRPDSRLSPYTPFSRFTWREAAAGLVNADERGRREDEHVLSRGRGLIAGLYLAARDLGVELRTGVRGTELLTEGGRVTGLRAGDDQLRGAVILASGGFEWNAELVRHFLKGPMLAPGSPPQLQGDGLVMGMAIGAALANMAEAWWSAALEIPGEQVEGAPYYSLLFGGIAQPGGIVVDRLGRRYADEATNYDDFCRSMHAFEATTFSYPRVPSFLVFDASRRRSGPIGPLTPDHDDPDWLAVDETIEGLAAQIEVPPEALAATVERFNGHLQRGSDVDFQRGTFARDIYSVGTDDLSRHLKALDEPPYYALKLLPGVLGTKGGLKTDSSGRVQRADGSGVIDGLFAAGNAAANPFGLAYPAGGGTIAPALVFGWLAGAEAAAR